MTRITRDLWGKQILEALLMFSNTYASLELSLQLFSSSLKGVDCFCKQGISGNEMQVLLLFWAFFESKNPREKSKIEDTIKYVNHNMKRK